MTNNPAATAADLAALAAAVEEYRAALPEPEPVRDVHGARVLALPSVREVERLPRRSLRHMATPGTTEMMAAAVIANPETRELFRKRGQTIAETRRWLDAEGPKSTALLRHLRSANAGYDYVFFFSYRYYHSYHGPKALPSRAILVPTAERDEAIGLGLSSRIFRGVRALMIPANVPPAPSPDRTSILDPIDARRAAHALQEIETLVRLGDRLASHQDASRYG